MTSKTGNLFINSIKKKIDIKSKLHQNYLNGKRNQKNAPPFNFIAIFSRDKPMGNQYPSNHHNNNTIQGIHQINIRIWQLSMLIII